MNETREDIGYTSNPVKYKASKHETFKPEKIRVRLKNGEVYQMAQRFADDLIITGRATRA